MLKTFDNGVFFCNDFQVEMFEELKATRPDVYERLLQEIKTLKLSHPSYERDVDVGIYGNFEANACQRIVKTMDEFHKFLTFEVKDYTTHRSTVQNSDWVTDSIVVHAKF